MTAVEDQRTEVLRPVDRAPRAPRALLWLLVPIPVLLATAEAIRSPKMNFNDYWAILAKVTGDDGVLRPLALFKLYNEHPIALVGPVFWLDAKLFDAANQALGLFSVALVLVLFATLVSMLPARLTGNARVAVIACLSALLFSSSALEFFGMGMSGVHWLVGIVPAVLALRFAHRGNTAVAVVFGVIGCFGHGAAFPIWVSLAMMAWLRRDELWRFVLPIGFGVLTLALWLLPSRQPGYPSSTLVGVDTMLGTALAMLGQVWAARSTDVAFATGTLTAAVFAFVVFQALPKKGARPAQSTVDDSGWFALAFHVVLVAIMVGFSRSRLGTAEALGPRYAMVALLGACALLVLLVLRGPRLARHHVVPLALTVAVMTYAVGSAQATAVRENYPRQPMLAVAMRVDARAVIDSMNWSTKVLPVLRSMKAYPFSDDFTLGCGRYELGSLVDMSRVKELPGPSGVSRTAGAVETGPVVGNSKIAGWAVLDGEAADCVLVVDGSSEVVGGGAVDVPRADVASTTRGTGRGGWNAVARPGVEDGVVLVGSEDQLYRISLVIKAG
ncbi:hypothetical protein [Umezawaea tangerina]|uniref:4-amino-4-deoxy-L-arabinose transferase-like glycosyltransferase n=1 Tax=Umezawaea tangerina TaxID=84725 RepID=A0A2T0TJW2_9PSEU|nr:hypothetical protein [Umezawaea tangerina]PRY45953.1 hypothetical protein CLV43_101216 [Umezawaea tangerina]